MVEDRNRDTLLYAGAAKVNITDWFFFKDKATFHYIGLDDALVNMKRRDSTWNYQFLIDYFSSPSSGNKKSKGIEFDFKKVEANNIRFNQIDQWSGRDLAVALEKLDVTLQLFDIENQKAIIESISISKPQFMQYDYTGNEPEVPDTNEPEENDDGISAEQNNPGWALQLKKLSISDGAVLIKKEMDNEPAINHFEGQYLFFNHINASIKDIGLSNGIFSGNVNLAATERSGLQVKKLQALVTVTSSMMEFKDLDLQTNRSRLGNYFAMHYNSFNSDMSRFLHQVRLEADFTNSELNSDDLAYFAPALSEWKKTFSLNGKARGTIDRFSTDDIDIKTGNSRFKGKLSMRGLPDINSTFIDLKSDLLQTNYKDLVTLVPALKNVSQPSLPKLGNIFYAGNFTGFIKDFVAYGTIRSDLGTVKADLNMKLPENGIAQYSGKLITSGFRLGSFINNPNLGDISMNGKINGRGFALKDLNVNVNGNISDIAFNGYRYKNINLNGDFMKNVFTGHASIDDPNLQVRSFDGAVNISGKEIAFNLVADMAYVNLKNLGFMQQNISMKGMLSLDFTGNNIDNFLGTARIYDASLWNDSTQLSFDSLRLQSTIEGDEKRLTLQSNEIDADISGQFTILELPDAFKVFLHRYYPAYIKEPAYWVKKQDLRFNIRTKEISEYFKMFDRKLSGFDYADISGNLNLTNYELNLTASVPSFIYDGKQFNDIRLTGSGNRDTLLASVSMSDFVLSDSLHFPDTKIRLSATNDVSDISIKTSAGKTLNDAEINASVQTFSDGVAIKFFPSYFTINDKKWLLEKDGELTLRSNLLDASEIQFRHNDQQIKIYTELDELTDHSHIVAKLEKINIEDFTPFFLPNPSMAGILTGTAMVREPFGKTVIEFKGEADSFSLEEKYIGKVSLDAKANTGSGEVNFNVAAKEKDYDFNIGGMINYLDSTGNNMNINVAGDKMNLNILEPFLGSTFSKIDGVAETKLQITGVGNDKFITGIAKLREASFLVAYTQCRYLMSNEVVKFEKNEMDFGRMRLRDTLGNTATLSGKLKHRFFDDMFFDNIRLETGKLLLLNTSKKDNSQFYGNVIGNANMSINGPLTNMVMNIDGRPSFVDSSHIYLPTGSDKESNAVDYIEFVKFGTLMGEEAKASESTNILVNLSVTANPACKVDVILDEETGDIIKGQGEGQINIKVGTREPLSIRGRYELTKGEYTFNFQTFLSRPFELNRGTISFNGDPYEANVDIDAEYKAKNVDISSLSPTGGFRQKEDVFIISHLTGSLKNPQIDFEFKLPEKSDANRNDIIMKRLADFKNDKNELNKQVASLLLFNAFISGEQNFLSGGSTISWATNTIGGIISGWLTNVFNKELEKATKGLLTTYIDINPTLDLQRNAAQLQANVRAGLKLFFNKRLQMIIAGNLDYNNPNFTQQVGGRGLLTPDISLEYLLTKDGTFRVVAFNRTSIDFTLNQLNRSGLQLSYRKDMNRISDIFKSNRKKLVIKKELLPDDNLVPGENIDP